MNQSQKSSKTQIVRSLGGQRLSSYQRNYLLSYLTENLDLANERHDFFKNDRTRSTAYYKKNWALLSEKLNSMDGTKKTPDQWRKTWLDMKIRGRTRLEAARHMIDFMNVRLSTVESQIIGIMLHDPKWQDIKMINMRRFEMFLYCDFICGNNAEKTEPSIDNLPANVITEVKIEEESDKEITFITDDDEEIAFITDGDEEMFIDEPTENKTKIYVEDWSAKNSNINPTDTLHTEPNVPLRVSTTINEDGTNDTNTTPSPVPHSTSIPSASYNPAPHQSYQEFYFEQRLLEINESLLREKLKQNKIAKKKNKILKQALKHQKKQTEALNKLLTLLASRS